MRRINTTNKDADAFGPGKHGWKNGVPGTADRPTEGQAEWFNSLQEEIAGVVEASEETLDAADNGQLLKAIRALTLERDAARPRVTKYGADSTGEDNSTAAFTDARAAANGVYHIPKGTYVVDLAFDVFKDSFTSDAGVTLVVGGVPYDVSNAISGAVCIRAVSDVLTAIVHAKSGNTLIAFQDGTPGTATYFYRGLAFETDSHFIQVKPKTVGGSTDLLFQRSAGHLTDPNGNRFNFTFQEATDRLLLSLATSISGAPGFDSFMEVVAGPTPTLKFPAVMASFNQGWEVVARAGATFGYRCSVGTGAHTFLDPFSGNTLCTVNSSGYTFRSVSWQQGAFPTGSLDFVTGGVAVAVAGPNSLQFFQNGSEAARIDTSRNFRPSIDGSYSLGAASFKWSVVYAASGTINTSDERAKQDIGPIPQAWLDAWGEVEFQRFRMRDAVSIKGDGARWHIGVVAQRIKEAFERRGIDPFQIGLLCYDEWADQLGEELIYDDVPVLDDAGEVIGSRRDVVERREVLAKPAGNAFGVRYEEALSLECAYLRARVAELAGSM